MDPLVVSDEEFDAYFGDFSTLTFDSAVSANGVNNHDGCKVI